MTTSSETGGNDARKAAEFMDRSGLRIPKFEFEYRPRHGKSQRPLPCRAK